MTVLDVRGLGRALVHAPVRLLGGSQHDAHRARRRSLIALGAALCVALAIVAVAVTRTDGYASRRVDLGDGGVWAVSDHDGMLGRVNLPVGGLDSALAPPGATAQSSQLDVVQDAVGVVARDRAQGKLFPVDAAEGTIGEDSGISLSPDAEVALGGGTIAVLEPASGKIWARRFDESVGLSNLSGIGGKAAPAAKLATGGTGGAAGTAGSQALAVGTDGAVHALSGDGRLVTLTPDASGLSAPSYRDLHVRLRAPRLTVVGSQVVALDAATGSVVLSNGRTVTLPERDPATVLQQPGPDAPTVLAATARTLFSIDLASGAVRRLSGAGTGTPAAPVVADGCGYAAWTGTPGATVRSCRGATATAVELAGAKALVQPQLRVNRGAAVVNDAVSGAVWRLPGGERVDDWDAIKPPTKIKPKKKENDDSNDTGRVDAPPHATADTLGARPGRATTLHVLDNDSDPAGSILSITSVTATQPAGAQLAVAPDGQTVQLTMPSDVASVKFRYTVDDAKSLTASAPVTVTARPFGTDRPPNLRPGYTPVARAVAAGGTLSLPVIGDWRDFDGDPPVLVSARTTAGTVSTTPDGRVNLVAPVDAGTVVVDYTVTDGMRETRESVDVNVLGVTSARTTPATASPDVARGQVGQPIVVRPLDNDLPGADPTDPGARLTLGADVAEPEGADVVTDPGEGTVTITAERAGTFVLTYLAAFGNAAYAKGTMRVDVTAAADKDAPPVAVLDTATVRGQRPVVVDVLDNDFDPAGRVLVVESSQPQNAGALQVAIVQGKYLRINALRPQLDPNPQLVDYTITDGRTASVTGQVSVSQLPEVASATPVPQDDHATVRAGDTVTVPVLENDVDPNGDTLTLNPDVTGAPSPGRLPVSATDGGAAGGAAYVSGTAVRYVAPTGITAARAVTVEYVVRNNSGEQAVGHVLLTVEPPPDAGRPDHQPTPPEIDRRVVAGDSVTVPIRTSMVDPDGDSVTLTGIGSGPTLGRVLGTTASGLRYQAYPSSAGTDSFEYTVTDRYGKSAEALMRIAVVPPGDPQPPVASDITTTAAPGSTVTVDVLQQAFTSADDRVTILPLARTNGTVPDGTVLTSPTGPIRVRASEDLRPVVVRYAIEDGLGAPSTATLRVRTVTGTDLPPVAADVVAKPSAGRDIVSVDPLARATDPDADPGRPAALRVSKVFDGDATVATDGTVSLPVRDRPQVVPYEITDGGGAAAVASIFVPAQGKGPPTAKADASIELAKNGTKSIDIGSYATDPAGKPLSLTTADQITASPQGALRVSQDGRTGLVLTAQDDYVGPAAVTFQVTDGTSLTDPDGVFGVITVPVQIGPETPVLRCPSATLPVVEGGAPLELDVATLCHVWVADPATLDDVRYTAVWQDDPGDIQLSGFGSATVRLAAAGGARPGSVGVVRIGVVGKDARPSTVKVSVQASPPPTVAPVTVDGLVAGRTATVDLADYVDSRLRDKAVSVVSASRVSGSAVSLPTSGSRLTITPAADAKGTIVIDVTVSDIADTSVARRQATGRVVVHVLGRPDAPTGVSPGRTALSHVAVVTWQAPADNGEPIDRYRVSWTGGEQSCAASPCTIRNLTNGRPYRFTVTAHNAVGFGRPSATSAAIVPNAVPEAPTALRTSDPQDHRLTLTWQPARVDGTPVLYYLLQWEGVAARKVLGTSATATGLDNDAVTRFTVRAVNKQGAGPAATASGQSSGTPQAPPPPAAPQQLRAPTLSPTNAGDHQVVRISWPAVDPNGPRPVTYQLTRDVGGQAAVVCSGAARSCVDDKVTNDGRQYGYSYTAANGTGHRSGASAVASFVARGTPEGVGGLTLTATGQDGQATLTYDERAVRDARAVVHCRVESAGGRSCGDFGIDGPDEHPNQRETLTGLPDGQVTISLEQCNTVGTCAAKATIATTVYGQLERPQLTNLRASGPNIDFDVAWNPHGGAVRVQVTVVRNNDNATIYDKTLTPGDTDDATHAQSFTDDVDSTLGTPVSAGSLQNVTVTVRISDASSLNRSSPDAATGTTQTGAVAVALGGNHDCRTDADPDCGHLELRLTGFQPNGQVRCTFDITGGSGATPSPVTVGTDGNGSYSNGSLAKYSDGGATIRVTCEAVTATYTWR